MVPIAFQTRSQIRCASVSVEMRESNPRILLSKTQTPIGSALPVVTKSALAMNGGNPVRTKPLPVMHPGAGYVGKEEIDAVTAVLKSKSMYRFYGPEFLNV